MVTKPISINEKEYFKVYKDLVKLCLKEGEILPTLLDVIDVPQEYDFTDKERSKLKLTKESSQSRQQYYSDLEDKLNSFEFTGDLKALDEHWNTVHNEELMSFIGRHLEYQDLIK